MKAVIGFVLCVFTFASGALAATIHEGFMALGAALCACMGLLVAIAEAGLHTGFEWSDTPMTVQDLTATCEQLGQLDRLPLTAPVWVATSRGLLPARSLFIANLDSRVSLVVESSEALDAQK